MPKIEENIPLEKAKNKKFKSTVAGIKNLLKSGKITIPKNQDKQKSKKDNHKAVVYIGHIPHGFYEEQMRDFFKQFGKVTNVRVARSAKNGNSKGYGFVEFAEREVAEIVAETMNNYLMDKRLLKAECISESRMMPNLFKGKNWTPHEFCPGIKNRNENKLSYNKQVSDEKWIEECKKRLKRLHNIKEKLKDLGIEFDFTPCDIPEQLIDFDPAAIKSKNSKTTSDEVSPNNLVEKTNLLKLLNIKQSEKSMKNKDTSKIIKNNGMKKKINPGELIELKKSKITKRKRGKSILSSSNK